MCCKMQQEGKGEVPEALPSLLLSPPSSQHPPFPPFSPSLTRDMCTRCASRQFQLWATDARTAAISPFPSFCSPNYSPFFSSPHCLHSFSLYFPLPSFYSVILPCTFSSGRYKGRSCWRERACVISGCTWAPESYCFSWKGNIKGDPQTNKGRTVE